MNITEIIYHYVEKRKSYDSQKNVIYIINSFLSFLDKDFDKIEKEDANKYLRYLIEKTHEGILNEDYVRMIFIELRAFYGYCKKNNYIDTNPFAGIVLPIHDKRYIETSAFPDLLEVNELLENVKDNNLYVAILLALRMALSTSEIINVKKEDIIYEKESGYIYLRIVKKGKIRYLLIPKDILSYIKKEALSTEENYLYLLSTNSKNKYSPRTLQLHLKKYSKNITFSGLRNLSIYLMFAGGANIEQVIGYTGMKGEWFKKYDIIPTKYKFDAVKYSKLQIIGN